MENDAGSVELERLAISDTSGSFNLRSAPPERPCLRAFRDGFYLPRLERGPVDLSALRLFAWRFWGLDCGDISVLHIDGPKVSSHQGVL
jgi:hypothetical protein